MTEFTHSIRPQIMLTCVRVSRTPLFMITRPTLFQKFNGIRPMAEALGESPSTIMGWKNAGRVPAHKQPSVLERAVELGIDITTDDVVFPLGRPNVTCDQPTETKAARA